MADNSRVPSYRLHRQSGQAIVTLTDGLGGYRDVLLGKHGTKASRMEYARVIAEWETGGRTLVTAEVKPDLSINELLVLFMTHAMQYYRRPDGSETSEVSEFRLSFKPLKRLYGHTPAASFGPLALQAVRESMIAGSWLTDEEKEKRAKKGHATNWARKVINKRVNRIRRCFLWASGQELLPAAVYHALMTVQGLEQGRSKARETEKVRPVVSETVTATLPFLRPQTRAMVELQMATGMRPGEVTIMRTCDLTMDGDVWVYQPGSDQGDVGKHKMAYKGQQRVIMLGPKAQDILRPWLRCNLGEYLFQPREAMAQLCAERRDKRQTPMTPSQAKRRPKRKLKKAPRDFYRTSSYAQAVADAASKAGVSHWHPHQLRHPLCANNG